MYRMLIIEGLCHGSGLCEYDCLEKYSERVSRLCRSLSDQPYTITHKNHTIYNFLYILSLRLYLGLRQAVLLQYVTYTSGFVDDAMLAVCS